MIGRYLTGDDMTSFSPRPINFKRLGWSSFIDVRVQRGGIYYLFFSFFLKKKKEKKEKKIYNDKKDVPIFSFPFS
jgi:hypothetical protein